MITRIGLLGDVHGAAIELARALACLGEIGVDQILCTGDVLDGRGDVNRCCRLLDHHKVATVLGNHDRWYLEGGSRETWFDDATPAAAIIPAADEYLRNLPATRRLESSRGPLLLCHGTGGNDMRGITPEDYGYSLEANLPLQELLRSDVRWVVAGHTHRVMVRHLHPLWVVNPGMVRDGFLLVDLGAEKVVQYATSTGPPAPLAEWDLSD